jgi:hypothetical protein
VSDAADFARLAQRLKDAGETGLRRELTQAINDSVKPFADEINAAEYLRPYMPDRYAETLAGDLRVSTVKQASASAYGVSVKVQGRLHRRQVQTLNRGLLRHPLFGERERWFTQTGGMKPGFFDDATAAAKPEIRQQVIDAINSVADKIRED